MLAVVIIGEVFLCVVFTVFVIAGCSVKFEERKHEYNMAYQKEVERVKRVKNER